MTNDDHESLDPQSVYHTLSEQVHSVLIGNEAVVERLTIALLTRGHVLLEGVPGVAKTTLANLVAQTLGLEYRRIQMTPDMLPADITGTTIYREHDGEFTLHRGPIFSNVVVADEINRATPKTQSALLEAMEERQVTIDGETHPLPRPFIVIATRNPIEMEGVFDLPNAQRDRFQFKLRMEIPDRVTERKLLDQFDENPTLRRNEVERVLSAETILHAQESVTAVHVANPVKSYILDIVEASRTHQDVTHGGSPRATLSLLDGVKALAAIRGRDYAIPDDVKSLVEPVLSHRLQLNTDADLAGVTTTDVIDTILETVESPDPDGSELSK